MDIYTDIGSMPFMERAVITLGTFDGVHVAHKAILKEVCLSAENINGKSVLVSFDTHPRKVIDPNFVLNILTTTEEKNEIFRQIGINTIIYINFNSNIAKTGYVEFISFLTQKIDIKKIVLGYNHSFGRDKEGNIENLTKLIPNYGFEIAEIPQQTIDGVKISSSSIRKAVSNGDFLLANTLLGYNYTVNARISSFTENNIFAAAQNTEKILPPKGKYEVKINNANTLLEIDGDICIQNKNFSCINKKEITIEFINKLT